MRRTLSIITLFSILLTACVGDPGPPGFDGQDGGLIVGFEGLHYNSIP